MKFTLVQSEIEQAIQDYIGKVITVKDGATVTVDLKNTRGTDGITAEVDVSLAPLTGVASAPVAPVKREAAPAPAAAKPVAETPAPAPVVDEPTPEVIGQAPVAPEDAPQEPTIPDDEPAPFENEEVAPAAPGKSIFG